MKYIKYIEKKDFQLEMRVILNLIQDMKDGKINKMIVCKLDRLTRFINGLETIYTLLKEYHCDLESVAEKIY